MTKSQIASYRFTKQAQKDIQRLIEQGRKQFGIKQVVSYFDELEKS
jgi:plasmid stabilization system protein ParE